MPLKQIQFQCIFNGLVRSGMEIYHISKSHDENVFGDEEEEEIYSETNISSSQSVSHSVLIF